MDGLINSEHDFEQGLEEMMDIPNPEYWSDIGGWETGESKAVPKQVCVGKVIWLLWVHC